MSDFAHQKVGMSAHLAQMRIKNDATDAFASLTRRQGEILELLSKGMTHNEVGGMLKISARTVEIHITAIKKKLRVGNIIEAAVMAAKAGLL